MIPIQCPRCELKWNIRDDAPDVVTCPRCLAPVAKPSQPIVPIATAATHESMNAEQQFVRDTTASRIGLWFIIILLPMGFVGTVFMTSWVRPARILVVAMGVTVALTVALAIAGLRTGKPVADAIGATTVLSGCLAAVILAISFIAAILTACGSMYKGL